MSDNVNYRKIYEALRDAGLVKMFETMSVRFFMGIASTLCKPITEYEFYEKCGDEYPIPDNDLPFVKATALKENSEDRALRYHEIISDIFHVHYIIFLSTGLRGRVKEMPHCDEAVTRVRVIDEEVTGTDDTVKKIGAVMLVGNGSINVNDNTRGPIIKHELCHIILKYLLDIQNPELNTLFDELDKDDYDNFIEFLCDFIQFDSTIVNKYTVNPITKFHDALEFIFKPGTEEKYAKYMRSIAPFFDEQT